MIADSSRDEHLMPDATSPSHFQRLAFRARSWRQDFHGHGF